MNSTFDQTSNNEIAIGDPDTAGVALKQLLVSKNHSDVTSQYIPPAELSASNNATVIDDDRLQDSAKEAHKDASRKTSEGLGNDGAPSYSRGHSTSESSSKGKWRNKSQRLHNSSMC